MLILIIQTKQGSKETTTIGLHDGTVDVKEQTIKNTEELIFLLMYSRSKLTKRMQITSLFMCPVA